MSMEINCSHILVKSKEEADRIAEKLKAGGDFAELASRFSVCPSGREGGNLGWFGKGAMVSEFENAAFALEKDETSTPVKTEFGWHLIKRLG